MNSAKITIALAIITVVSAGSSSYVKRSDDFGLYGSENIYQSDSYGAGSYAREYKDYYAYPKYKFEYGVHDPHTGDHKSQWEVRDGDVVKGEYTMDEADGTIRKVSYYADDKTGFHAKVEKIGHATHDNYYGGAYAGY